MNKLLVLFILTFSINISALDRDCIRRHLRDAISINKQRLPLYSKLSEGKSIRLSRSLIAIEKLSLALMAPLERASIDYRKKGVNLLCHDFIEMDQTPMFSNHRVFPNVQYSDVKRFDTFKLRKKLLRSLKSRRHELDEILVSALDELSSFPRYNCLLRHLLESIRRSVHLIDYYVTSSKLEGLSSPMNILKKNLKIQIYSLGLFHRLDKMAAPLQEQGIPILCQDVPAIPHIFNEDLLN